ncbi:Dihydropyrimidine dehydrogenase (NADP(+)) [Lathyrus oleraceus]|uniref:Dihydropyrimidine dehydrogenase (NADP(+)) n=2 Tax=Pisum sativum TaxID=3888 RepID=A0A9D5AWM5_PEA|nr:Dihydropyrimidine dehydrogenase (NADP(+)) [Pisum sativum]
MVKVEFDNDNYSLSTIGGVETCSGAAEFILLGTNTVQMCTGVMMHDYGLVEKLSLELKDYMIDFVVNIQRWLQVSLSVDLVKSTL